MTAENKASILVVDDNPAKRLALVSVLEELNQNIVVAESGRDALRLLLNHEYAVVLLDVRMPDMDGFETAELIRSRQQSEMTPIIFVTAYAHAEKDMLNGYSLGAVDFIFTPIIPEILRAKVSVFVDLYQKIQEIKRHEDQLESLVAQRTAALKAEIAERVQTQERLHYLAHHDPLTDMPNRMLFVERLDQALNRAQWHKRVAAVLFIDLDRFKIINDTLGHEAGDRLLKGLPERLAACVREGDTVARFGGDEFAVFLNDVASFDDVAPIARKLLDALAPPFAIDGQEFFITGSIGISLYPEDGRDAQSLMKHADSAMYRAKLQGGNTYQFYQGDMNAHAVKRLELKNALRRAIERQELILHYQPRVDLNDGGIVGVEALIRWQPLGSGVVPPVEYIQLPETIGLTAPMVEGVLRTASAQCRSWQAVRRRSLRVAVNLSGWHFNSDLIETIRSVIRLGGVEPALLEIKIPASILLKNADPAADILQTMAALGVRFSVDDFGAGYSSLKNLKRLPIDVLSTDKVVARDLAGDPEGVATVRALISMAHSVGLKVNAEGIETSEQLEYLRAQGCDFAQGYYFGPPQAPDEIGRLLKEEESLVWTPCSVRP